VDLHESVALQDAQRFAHRAAADLELIGDLLLLDARAGLVTALDDGVADTLGDLLGKRKRLRRGAG
jgi:hypothetical protein